MNTLKTTIGVFAIGFAVNGQTINLGEITILPDTRMVVMEDLDNTPTGNITNDGELFLHSNFNNDGAFTYLDATNNGMTGFIGDDSQQITGEQLIEFYDVRFDNTIGQDAIGLVGDITIVNRADFLQGVVNNAIHGGSITFEDFAAHSNASNRSHVDGEVLKDGNEPFVFPVGDNGNYRMARISAPDMDNEFFSSQYFFENSNMEYPHHLKDGAIDIIDANEYWVIDRVSGNSSVAVTLGWDTATTPGQLTSRPELLHIVRWNTDLGHWVDEGGIVDETAQTVTTVSEVTGYGIFTLAKIKEDVVLPGDLVVYNAITPNGNGLNDFLHIKGIDRFPNNTVRIFNRWGTKVFETRGYNETDNVFRGFSDGNLTISRNKFLPAGTYFYVLEYEYQNGTETNIFRKAGYLYINEN